MQMTLNRLEERRKGFTRIVESSRRFAMRAIHQSQHIGPESSVHAISHLEQNIKPRKNKCANTVRVA